MDARSLRMAAGISFVIGWAALPLSVEALTGHVPLFDTPDNEQCVLCHTPHHAPSSKLLWNHVLSANNFSWSDWTKTTGGTTLPKNIGSWSGSSKMCLSCHDGSVAVGAIYTSKTTLSDLKLSGRWAVAASGDLKGNHPIAIPYPYDGVKNTYNGITTGDEALDSGWVKRPTKVKLYTDFDVQSNNHGIECATCHDPHGTSNKKYLRDTMQGSQLCLDCHVK